MGPNPIISRARGSAFTLIELLIVIAIILVLAALLFPVFISAKESTQKGVALVQAGQIGKSMYIYVQEHDSKYLPSTNYGMAGSTLKKIWVTALKPYIKDERVFIAPESQGVFPKTWDDRGRMTIGYSTATAIDISNGCPTDLKDASGCLAFDEALSFDKGDNPSVVAMLAVTPGGSVSDKYLGYEFNPYNGVPDFKNPEYAPPLTSDRDLVKELSSVLPAAAMKPIYARYLSTGRDTGETPMIFADGHAKCFSAAQINGKATGIVWRFR